MLSIYTLPSLKLFFTNCLCSCFWMRLERLCSAPLSSVPSFVAGVWLFLPGHPSFGSREAAPFPPWGYSIVSPVLVLQPHRQILPLIFQPGILYWTLFKFRKVFSLLSIWNHHSFFLLSQVIYFLSPPCSTDGLPFLFSCWIKFIIASIMHQFQISCYVHSLGLFLTVWGYCTYPCVVKSFKASHFLGCLIKLLFYFAHLAECITLSHSHSQ